MKGQYCTSEATADVNYSQLLIQFAFIEIVPPLSGQAYGGFRLWCELIELDLDDPSILLGVVMPLGSHSAILSSSLNCFGESTLAFGGVRSPYFGGEEAAAGGWSYFFSSKTRFRSWKNCLVDLYECSRSGISFLGLRAEDSPSSLGGEALGLCVLEVGSEGSLEGSLVGSRDGSLLGSLVGSRVGSLEGSLVGSLEGSLVGSLDLS